MVGQIATGEQQRDVHARAESNPAHGSFDLIDERTPKPGPRGPYGPRKNRNSK